jgi:hypothetical protein
MTAKEAQEFIQKTMMRIQQEKMSKQPAMPTQPTAPQQAPQPAK